jgi:phosphotriesterase-related protein
MNTGISQIMTVRGPIAPEALGVTLMHEHILIKGSGRHGYPEPAFHQALADRPVSIDILGALRNNPFCCFDNCQLLDEQTALEELGIFAGVGGQTIVDPTCHVIGRYPQELHRLSVATGLNIIIGCGYYLEQFHSPHLASTSLEEIQHEIEADVLEGEDDIRAGIIGEIGISAAFTEQEEKVLRAAARAQVSTRVPLEVHLPGWERHAHRVLDIVEEEGVDPQMVVLCHMNPSGHDFAYQQSLAQRRAYLGYDMIGMDFYYADQNAQSPCDEENALALVRLAEAGLLDRVLISQDVFLKTQLVRYGGTGYAHIMHYFVPRLLRHGFTRQDIDQLLVVNPRSVFTYV